MAVLGQFLSSALGSICRRAELAPSIVGTASDVRDLVAYRLGLADGNGEPPLLGRGWRAEVVGRLIDDLLAGKLAIRIHDPLLGRTAVVRAGRLSRLPRYGARAVVSLGDSTMSLAQL